MITDKPTQVQLVTFLKGLSDDELDELLVTRAHHNNTVPIEFVSKSTGTSCGIDNDGMQLAMCERVGRSNTMFEELGLKARRSIPDGVDNLLGIIKDNHRASGIGARPFGLAGRPVIAGLDAGPLGEGKFSTGPSRYFYEERGRRVQRMGSTERFEKFVKELPLLELFELGDMIVEDPNRRALGDYRSVALNQAEVVYHTDLQLIYEEIKSRVKQKLEVK